MVRISKQSDVVDDDGIAAPTLVKLPPSTHDIALLYSAMVSKNEMWNAVERKLVLSRVGKCRAEFLFLAARSENCCRLASYRL